MTSQDFEKLGSFYLGKLFDPAEQQTRDELLLYDAKDLTTHAMCVGMTGSGKTGLCVSLLEEAALDGIPAIVIDPKGDLGNLLLSFPELSPSDFRPWVDESEALRKGQTAEAYATRTAETWRKGLADWGQGPERIAALRKAADFAIYTPGSTAGLPVTLLRSFAAPPAAMRSDSDAVRDRIMAAVSGLLALLGVDADPIQSREHILLSNILSNAWSDGRDLEVADLIREIQTPPMTKLGVFDLETFYPAKERGGLAMRLNNVLASPSFAVWMEGEPLNVGRLLYTTEGRPRISVLSIAHLSDSERMFFVTLLLNEVVAWMRTQPGTSSLRALLYMDEIYGYFPPSANPPSKTPMLTLLKQARAYGLGCVLATQNPVDLDYKGLGNTGTWFIGRLQTERDKARVLDGLEGATSHAGKRFDRAAIEKTLSGLGKRVFLMNNVHEDAPVLFQTRWVMSYLRGPLTRTQIESLMADRKAAAAAAQAEAAPQPALAARAAMVEADADPHSQRNEKPRPPTGVSETFLRPTGSIPEESRLVYRPALFATGKLHFANARVKVDQWTEVPLLAPLPEEGTEVAWSESSIFEKSAPERERAPAPGASFSELPAAAENPKNFSAWEKSLKTHLYQSQTLTLWKCPELKLLSEPGETEGDMRVRVTQAAHEQRDLAVEKLRKRYAPRMARLQERIRKAEMRMMKEEEQYKQQKMQTFLSIGTTLLGALLGRRTASVTTARSAASSVGKAGRAARERGDITRAQEDIVAAQRQLEEMEARFQEETAALKEQDPADLALEEVLVRPRKSDISLSRVALAWTPWKVSSDGIAEPLF